MSWATAWREPIIQCTCYSHHPLFLQPVTEEWRAVWWQQKSLLQKDDHPTHFPRLFPRSCNSLSQAVFWRPGAVLSPFRPLLVQASLSVDIVNFNSLEYQFCGLLTVWLLANYMTFLSLDGLLLQIWILKKSDIQDLNKDYMRDYFWVLYVPGMK